MGILSSARSLDLCLQREDFPKALKELKRLARERPAQLDDPAGVIRAARLEEALSAALWRPELDDHGDLVALEYLADKLPPDAMDASSLFAALARAAISGSFLVWLEGRETERIVFRRGKVWTLGSEASTFSQLGRPPRAAPGETVRLRFRMNDGVEAPPRRLQLWNSSREMSLAGVDAIEYDGSRMRPGEEREVEIRLSPTARGEISLSFACVPEGRCTPFDFSLHVAVERLDEIAAPWTVISCKSWPSKSVILRPADQKRALVQAQRFAARYAAKPGGEFLAEVARATSVDEVLRAANLSGSLGARPSELRFAGDRLPGAERIFWGLLRALSVYVADKPDGVWTTLMLHYAHAPELEYRYCVGQRASREILLF